ncbi:50S ribosomal protein L1 [Candidatus Nesciobacter abundans]|uniref:Ribosomal protein n=1 Tax=Candidatus Nesciobacter abundans TaxID=2601668 RepID=A0A5C0UHV2_9PROT|nr:50S ribosomal protein L1 [Candidatus Nesciobacter abundans]QEK39231.1 50S ribosomal protein L1 [Candidatus Nesciobacter abundans]
MGKNINNAGSKLKKILEDKKVESVSLKEALDLIKDLKFAKFEESVDVSFNLKKDPKKANQPFKVAIPAPKGTGKKKTIAVFGSDSEIENIKDSGADYLGNDQLVEDFKSGKIDCDICLSSVEGMKYAKKLSRILGPKGKMPNVKLGTISQDLDSLVKSAIKGIIFTGADAQGNLHAGIGKISLGTDSLVENFTALCEKVLESLPKGMDSLNSIFVKTTMSPSVEIDKNSLKGIV